MEQKRGKRTGRHPRQELTAIKVKQLKTPGRYADGNGLYLLVDANGSKRWILRTMVGKRRTDIGLGGLSWVSLAEARAKAYAIRKIAREGGDPVALKRATPVSEPTFREIADRFIAERKEGWRNAKHQAQWSSTLQTYVYPILGEMPVSQIGTAELLKVLTPIWTKIPETARRVRQRIGQVLDLATAEGYRDGLNPIETVMKALPRQPEGGDHHEALPYAEVPEFVGHLRESTSNEIVRLAFELLILTATRTNEVLGAKWPEIDFDTAVWTIPADRMKAKREHRVPLSRRARAILKRARELAIGGEFAFPGQRPGKPLSNMVFTQFMRRLNLTAVPHGFRSSFRDWASESTNFPTEVCEMALAHVIKNKVEAAYRRGDLLEKRRELMSAWADYVEHREGSDEGTEADKPRIGRET